MQLITLLLTIVVYLPIMPSAACMSDPAAIQFHALLMGDARQERQALACDSRLMAAAQARVAVLAREGNFAHCDLSGRCANEYVRAEGCILSGDYMLTGNNVESLIGGHTARQIETAYTLLSNSPKHARHLFGQDSFYRNHNRIGIAVLTVPGSVWDTYISIVTASCLGN